MTAATACRTCGTEPREGARFCDGCGSLVAPATEHAEYKQATVLFADVVHSTDIAAAVGAERLGEIMSAPPPPSRKAFAHNSVRGPTRPRRSQFAKGGPVPARMCQSKAACRSPAASRCSPISAAFSSADPRASIAAARSRCNCARSHECVSVACEFRMALG